MNQVLPKDLFEAEKDLQKSLLEAIREVKKNRLLINLNIQNIRLNPIISRLIKMLSENHSNAYLLWSDEGASALAKRDINSFYDRIFSFNSFKQVIEKLDHNNILIAINPQPYDFDEFKSICDLYNGKVIMFNGRLEDTAIGIGNIARERRKSFISSWHCIYWLQPITKGAIMKKYNSKWILYKLIADGYIYCESFDNKPDEETILESYNLLN